MIIRPPTIDDLDGYHALLQDKDIQKYLGGSPDHSTNERHLRHRIGELQRLGYGLMMVIDRASDTLIGYCKLQRSPLEPPDNIEIVYGLLPAWRKKGRMSEAAAKVIDLVFGAKKIERIIGRVEPENTDSRDTLLGLGFQRRLEDRIDPLTGEVEHVYFVTPTSLKTPFGRKRR